MDTMEIIGSVAGAAGATVNVVKNFGSIKNSLTGALPRAMLFVPKVSPSSGTKKGIHEDADISELRKLVKKQTKSSTQKMMNKLKAGQQLGLQETQSQAADIKNSYQEIASALQGKNYVCMEVQYNPSTLRLNTQAGLARETKSGGDAAVSDIRQYTVPPTTRLNCELIFDQVNVADSFMMEGMSLSFGDIMEMGGNIMTNVGMSFADGDPDNRLNKLKDLWGTGYSVQVPVEGLLSLLHFERTKSVIFFWSEMFFHGQLIDVQAQYTMFNKIGAPVRARVGLTIEQTDTQDLYTSDNLAWEEAFDALFGEAGTSQYTMTQKKSIISAALSKMFAG